MDNISAIIWDWNGTLFNDKELSVFAINQLLEKRGIPQVNEQKYLDAFDFPVRDYYERIGFDFEKEPFEVPAMEYIETYYAYIHEAALHKGTVAALEHFKLNGFRQFVLSAAEQGKLDELLVKFDIATYFDAISGLDHHYATSKIELGKEMLSRNQLNAREACLIGDTTHDFEVAEAIGCRCVLISGGHQPVQKLKKTGCEVLENIEELPKLFGG